MNKIIFHLTKPTKAFKGMQLAYANNRINYIKKRIPDFVNQNDKDFAFGMIILESPPQQRTIFHNYYENHSSKVHPINLKFPNLIFVISYVKIDNKYIYEGLNYVGLQIFTSQQPLQTFEDTIFPNPLDLLSCGMVCTPHEHDYKAFDSLEELTDFVMGLWWGMTHEIECFDLLDFWQNDQLFEHAEYKNGMQLKLIEIISRLTPIKNKKI